jgi:hypothetical protein
MAALTTLEQVLAKPVELVADRIPILSKYNQNDIATELYDWIFNSPDEDTFLRAFAVPHMVFWTGEIHRMHRDPEFLGPDDIADGINVLPCTAAMFNQTDPTGALLPLTEPLKRFLKRRPYRVRSLYVSMTMDGDISYDCAQFTTDTEYLPGFVYCEYDPAANRPTYMTEAIYRAMIRSSLKSFTFLPEKDPTLVSIDLYLNRHKPQPVPGIDPGGRPFLPLGWHSDSDTFFGDTTNTGPRTHIQNAEFVEYVELLYLMGPTDLARTVTVIVNETSIQDQANPTPFTLAHRNALSFPAGPGTTCFMNNQLLFHTSPPDLIPVVTLESGLQDAAGNQDAALLHPSPLAEEVTIDERQRMLRDTQRCFLRVHYTNLRNKRFEYRLYGDGALPTRTMTMAEIGVPIINPNAVSVPVTTNANGTPNLSQINTLLGPQGPFHQPVPAQAATAVDPGHGVLPAVSLGGTRKKKVFKRKTKRMRGGVFTDSFLLCFHVVDYYYFYKYRNSLIVIA